MLNRIVEAKKPEIKELIASLNIDNIEPKIQCFEPYKFFKEKNGEVAVIAELKKASPIKGMLCEEFDPRTRAHDYVDNGASIISVITEKNFFEGSREYLQEVRKEVNIPLLRKDFIIHELQLYESLQLGADLVLLIAALFDYEKLLYLSEKSLEIRLEPLVEVHDPTELQLALDLPVRMIGINNRNLKDFTVDINNSLKLGESIPDSLIKVSESGIKSVQDLKLLEENGFSAALIGETLVRASNPGEKLRELVHYREEGKI